MNLLQHFFSDNSTAETDENIKGLENDGNFFQAAIKMTNQKYRQNL
jgi:hypothetical protein